MPVPQPLPTRRVPALGHPVLVLALVLASGCASPAPAVGPDAPAGGTVVFGQVVAVLTGPTTRAYEPEVRFLEVMGGPDRQRYRVDVPPKERLFIFRLPPGAYELTRVQIHEGPFMSQADLNARFQVGAEGPIYLGTWRFGVDAPRYGRMVVVSLVQDEAERAVAETELARRYPDLAQRPVTVSLPTPSEAEARLYEVASYPRIPQYFRRHWW